MALYRCAACGSPNIVTDNQVDGIRYDFVKGAIGTVALGMGGAAAGITSGTQKVFKCPDCGVVLTYPMPDDIKAIIDIGIESLDARSKLTLAGVPIQWSFLVKKYPNIGSGFGDYQEKEIENEKQLEMLRGMQLLRNKGTATIEEFDLAINIIRTFYKRIEWTKLDGLEKFTTDKPLTLPEYITICRACDTIVENCYRLEKDHIIMQESSFEDVMNGTRANYKGLDKFDYRTLFGFYVVRKYFEDMHKYIRIKPHHYGVDLSAEFGKYISNNRFMREVFIQLFNHEWNYQLYQKANFDEPTKIEAIWFKEMRVSIPPFVAGNSLENYDRVYIPCWKIENSKLYYLENAYKDHNYGKRLEISSMREAYYSAYPELKKEYEESIKKSKEQEGKQKAIDSRIPEIKKDIENKKSKITLNYSYIDNYKKKIFGRKQANIEIEYLENSNNKLRVEIEELENEIKELSSSRPDNFESSEEIETRYMEECDYYILWHETKADYKPISPIGANIIKKEIEEGPIIESPEKETKANSEILNAAAIKEYKKLLDEGIISQDEFDAKKKQLLGL